MTTAVGLGVAAGLGLLAMAIGGAVAPATEDAVALPSSAPTPPTASGSSPVTEVSSAVPSVTVSDDGTAMAALVTLQVNGRAPKTGYERERFGQKWADIDRNGCDTRNDVLRRDLSDARTTPGSNGCAVARGTLADPYTGISINFIRGSTTTREIHVDHVVALSDAWQKGAQQWDREKLTRFANDPLNLLAVQGTANMQKGEGDAATWLPPNKSYRCDYVARQVAVKASYGLWVTAAEYAAIEDILERCPGKDVVTSAEPPRTADSIDAVAAPESTEPSTPATTTVSSPAATGSPAEDMYYENCTAAREAGAPPLLPGEPGYRSAMDGDNDGVACE